MANEERKKILEVEHLSMHFSTGRGKKKTVVKAINDVSFHVYESETFGLVGESGCGKTTTGRALIRLYDPTSGSIKFNGRELTGPMTSDLRKYITSNMGMIFQDPIDSLNPRFTIVRSLRKACVSGAYGTRESSMPGFMRCWTKWGLPKSTPPGSLTSFPAASASVSALPGPS